MAPLEFTSKPSLQRERRQPMAGCRKVRFQSCVGHRAVGLAGAAPWAAAKGRIQGPAITEQRSHTAGWERGRHCCLTVLPSGSWKPPQSLTSFGSLLLRAGLADGSPHLPVVTVHGKRVVCFQWLKKSQKNFFFCDT